MASSLGSMESSKRRLGMMQPRRLSFTNNIDEVNNNDDSSGGDSSSSSASAWSPLRSLFVKSSSSNNFLHPQFATGGRRRRRQSAMRILLLLLLIGTFIMSCSNLAVRWNAFLEKNGDSRRDISSTEFVMVDNSDNNILSFARVAPRVRAVCHPFGGWKEKRKHVPRRATLWSGLCENAGVDLSKFAPKVMQLPPFGTAGVKVGRFVAPSMSVTRSIRKIGGRDAAATLRKVKRQQELGWDDNRRSSNLDADLLEALPGLLFGLGIGAVPEPLLSTNIDVNLPGFHEEERIEVALSDFLSGQHAWHFRDSDYFTSEPSRRTWKSDRYSFKRELGYDWNTTTTKRRGRRRLLQRLDYDDGEQHEDEGGHYDDEHDAVFAIHNNGNEEEEEDEENFHEDDYHEEEEGEAIDDTQALNMTGSQHIDNLLRKTAHAVAEHMRKEHPCVAPVIERATLRIALPDAFKTLDVESPDRRLRYPGARGWAFPFHFDCFDNMIMMLAGSKRVISFPREMLLPPPTISKSEELVEELNSSTNSSAATEVPDPVMFLLPMLTERELDILPYFLRNDAINNKHVTDVTLHPGDTLLVPVDHMHFVYAIGGPEAVVSMHMPISMCSTTTPTSNDDDSSNATNAFCERFASETQRCAKRFTETYPQQRQKFSNMFYTNV